MKTILLLILSFGIQFAHAGFEESSRRYMSGPQILNTLQEMFPKISFTTPCQKLSDENRLVIGDNIPRLGSPASDVPTQAFVIWYSNCISEGIRSSVVSDSATNEFVARYIGPELSKEINMANGFLWTKLEYLTVSKVSDLALASMIQLQVFYFLGSDDVIADFGLIEDPKEFRMNLLKSIRKNPEMTLYDMISMTIVTLSLRDEFLSY